MGVPRVERVYRVSGGWLVGTRTVAVRRAAGIPRPNHDARRAMRRGAMSSLTSKRLRGKRQHQNHSTASPSGPSAKALDRLQDYAQRWHADGVAA